MFHLFKVGSEELEGVGVCTTPTQMGVHAQEKVGWQSLVLPPTPAAKGGVLYHPQGAKFLFII